MPPLPCSWVAFLSSSSGRGTRGYFPIRHTVWCWGGVGGILAYFFLCVVGVGVLFWVGFFLFFFLKTTE